jgi:hypothetical protein
VAQSGFRPSRKLRETSKKISNQKGYYAAERLNIPEFPGCRIASEACQQVKVAAGEKVTPIRWRRQR